MTRPSPSRTLFAALLALGGWHCIRSACASDTGFAVIASPGVGLNHLSRKSLALIYRRRQNLWPNGDRIHPVNLPANNPLRVTFSRCVLGQTPRDTEDYWRQMYFHGTLPPYVLASQQAVELFVASTRGAIGYVTRCPQDARVVVLMVFGHPAQCRPPDNRCAPLQDS